MAACEPDGASGHASGSGADERDGGKLVWHPPDSGTVAMPPTGGSGTGGTSGTAGSSAPMCAMRRSPLPSALLPRCKPETGACMAGCNTAADPDSCREACIAADDTPKDPTYGLDCGGCIYLQLFACVDAAGCHEGVADVFCCIAEKCPAGSPEGCGEDRCGPELMTALTCGYFANMACTDFTTGLIAQCYGGDVDLDAGL